MIEVMKKAAQNAGNYMLGSDERTQTNKSNAKDFVTIADIKSQNILRELLQEAYADAVILSEEDSEEERQQLYSSDFTGFVLDPIDGTYNFKRNMKESAISIGYIERSESVAGVIFDPYRDELYWASRGKGAYCNGIRIAVSAQDTLEASSIATSNSYDDDGMRRNLARHIAIYDTTGHMPWTSCPGSGVLIMAWVACGRIDAYHHNGLKPWDNAAAFVLIREAGGDVQTLSGTRAMFTDSCILSGTPKVVGLLGEVFTSIDSDVLR